jgi:hypothetical protein
VNLKDSPTFGAIRLRNGFVIFKDQREHRRWVFGEIAFDEFDFGDVRRSKVVVCTHQQLIEVSRILNEPPAGHLTPLLGARRYANDSAGAGVYDLDDIGKRLVIDRRGVKRIPRICDQRLTPFAVGYGLIDVTEDNAPHDFFSLAVTSGTSRHSWRVLPFSSIRNSCCKTRLFPVSKNRMFMVLRSIARS